MEYGRGENIYCISKSYIFDGEVHMRYKKAFLFFLLILTMIVLSNPLIKTAPAEQGDAKMAATGPNADIDRQCDLVIRNLRVANAGVRKRLGIRTTLKVNLGDTIGIRFSVFNRIGQSGSFHISVYFAPTNSLSGLNPGNRIFHIPIRSLRENQKALIINKEYKVPVNCSLGNHYVVVVADAENQVSETSESNNRASVRLQVGGFPRRNTTTQAQGTAPNVEKDIAVQNLNLSDSTVNNDEEIQVSFKVKNLGMTTFAQVDYNICLSPPSFIIPCRQGAHQLGNGILHNIGPGESKNVSGRFTIPYDINGDRFKKVCVILNKDHLREDKNPVNNSAWQSITIIMKLPDLKITRLHKRDSGWPDDGASFDVDFTVFNRGNRKANPCKYKIRFLYVKKGETRYRYYGTRTADIPEMLPNHSWPGSVSFTMPPYGRSSWKKIYFSMKVDSDNEVLEHNEDNNSWISPFYWNR
jgi:hypothetical protein